MSSSEESRFIDAAERFTSSEKISIIDNRKGEVGDSRFSFTLGKECFFTQENFLPDSRGLSVVSWKPSERTRIASNIWPVCVASQNEAEKWVVIVKYLDPSGNVFIGRVPLSELNELGDHKAALDEMLRNGAQIRNCGLLAQALGAWIDFGNFSIFCDGKRVPRMMANEKVTKEEMKEWFYDNYKTPADGVPYDGREGGYIYTNGGPFDCEELLWDAFGNDDTEEDLRNLAIEINSEHGDLWVPVDDY